LTISLAGRDIGELPVVVNPQRKALAAGDFRFFCESHFPSTFHLPWSNDHLKVIGKIERAVFEGGLFAMAMPRSSGKTTACECASIWAMLYGHPEWNGERTKMLYSSCGRYCAAIPGCDAGQKFITH
jgi:hypothetical protein